VALSPSSDTITPSGADHDSHRVTPDEVQHQPRHRIEQPGIDHDAEIQDGEAQHHAGRCQIADAVQHHAAHRAAEAGKDGKGGAHQDQREQSGKAARHDQGHEHHDHEIGEKRQHAAPSGIGLGRWRGLPRGDGGGGGRGGLR
jgi:hypothetical protein